ncbi:amidohydrolase [Phycicoccus sp. Soil803]|uniref:amidohydrolase n=1 Tax=Phycicoccus sp. Soil803 TaxID=1736415 RepID=UPI001F3134CB|nr:amidohydrolase [Phycicoccus sp. Soil803]
MFTGRGYQAGRTTALVVVDGRIAAFGTDADVEAYRAEGDDVIDLAGLFLAPAFIDAHAHSVMGGIERNRCDLSETTEPADYRATVVGYAAANQDNSWILGAGWAISAFPAGLPTRQTLDEWIGDRPVYLPNRDHHSAWVSSAALRLAGIDADTADPEDGRIEREENGTPSGVLHEGAMHLVEAHVPADTQDDFDAGLRTALANMHSVGVASWQDAWVTTDTSKPSNHAAYLRAAREGWLTAKVTAALWWERSIRHDLGYERYRIHTVKVMQDGIAETFTAAMLDPYLEGCGWRTENEGISFLDRKNLINVTGELDRNHFQVHFHALGDRAVRDCLDAIELAQAVDGRRDRRHHLVHTQFIDDTDVPRFAEFGVVANAQALWATQDADVEELTFPFVGSERGDRQYPFGELDRAGAAFATGSDWPVSLPDPIAAIHVAVNRFDPGQPAGTEPLGTDQALTLETALLAYTAGSAFVTRQDDETGEVRVGAAADLVVLDRDPFAVESHQIGDIKVDHTFVDGELVFTRLRGDHR